MDKTYELLKESWNAMLEEENSLIIQPPATQDVPLSNDSGGMLEDDAPAAPATDGEAGGPPPAMHNMPDCPICQFNEDFWSEDEEGGEEPVAPEVVSELTAKGDLEDPDIAGLSMEPDQKSDRFNRDIYKKELGKYADPDKANIGKFNVPAGASKSDKKAIDRAAGKVATLTKQAGQSASDREAGNNGEDELLFDPVRQGPATYGDMAGHRDVPDDVIGKSGINIAADPDAYLDHLKQLMLSEPSDDKLFGQNGKLAKSGDPTTIFYDFTLPAYKGIYYSKKFDDFQMLTTCPSAKDCKKFCYARKGNFTQYPKNNLPRSNMLSFLMNEPQRFVQKMVAQIKKVAATQLKKGKKLYFRWHDSGDFFSPTYARIAFYIARQTPGVLHYAYTKQAEMFKGGEVGEKPDNFTLNFSFGGKNDRAIDMNSDKFSLVIKPETDLPFALGQFKKSWKNLMDSQTELKKAGSAVKKAKAGVKKATTPEAQGQANFAVESATKSYQAVDMKVDAALKQLDSVCMDETFRANLEKKFKLPAGSVITYYEMVDKPEDQSVQTKWNVLVYPGCGDISAARRDVAGTLLLIH